MEIIFQSHHATVSQFMRDRAERGGKGLDRMLDDAVHVAALSGD